MGLFGKIVATAINVATLPVAVVQDVVTLGGVASKSGRSFVVEKLEQIKEEAQ